MSEISSRYTVLHVPDAASSPSHKCMQWNADGQLCFITKSAVYILTPDLGINIGNSLVTKALPGLGVQTHTLEWFRTVIEFNKGVSRNWAEHSQEWGAVSLGSLDVSVRAIACSPSGLTLDAGCVIAVLNSNMELTLWASSKNFLNGKWTTISNVTDFLVEYHSRNDHQPEVAISLQAQVMCLAWSSQPDFGICPAPQVNGSLLIVGNRGGSVSLLRYSGDCLAHIKTIKVADHWITNLAISDWILEGRHERRCHLSVAFTAADGSIGLIRVVQSLQPQTAPAPLGSEYTPEISVECAQQTLVEADNRATTGIVWLSGSSILVYFKPGTVHFFTMNDTPPLWRSSRVLEIRQRQLAPSHLSSVSGIVHVPSRDALIFTLSDGSFHVAHNISAEPSWISRDYPMTSDRLLAVARGIFAQLEPGAHRVQEVNRISGMAAYDNSGIVTWTYEPCRPSDLSYKYDAKRSSVFITARIWETAGDDFVLDELARTLGAARVARGDASIHLLRPILIHLRVNEMTPRLHTCLMDLLQSQPIDDDSFNLVIPSTPATFDPQLRDSFRRSLGQHLFGWDVLLSLRLRLAITDFCWKLSEDLQRQRECGEVAQTLLNAISHRTLRIVYRHLGAILAALTPNDVPFVQRTIIQSSLLECPPDLAMEARNLSSILHAMMPGGGDSADEPCPACGVPIPLHSLTSAMCVNGHTWSRCSVTSFILSTPMVRTCVGCTRKAFLPASQSNPEMDKWLPVAMRSWVAEEFLEAVNRCLFCGNNFLRVL